MASIQANWEDEENNRHVGLDVEYQLVDGRVKISGVTPTRVSFFEAGSSTHVRSIGVWTESGRALLVRRAIESGRIQALEGELQSQATVELAKGESAVITQSDPCPLSA